MELWTAFLLGLVGSLHCAGMCGPLALALPHSGSSHGAYVLGRVGYNLGRVLTYCAMGLVFGAIGKSFVMVGVQRWMSIGLGALLLAGLLFSRRLALWVPVTFFVGRLKQSMSGLLRNRSFSALVLLGLLNGLLPCGLVYVACAGAATMSGVRQGMEYMAAFGIGTVPLMFAISVSGKLVPFGLRLKLLKAVPVAVFLVGSLLILRGLSLGIPYLSPDLAASCCHK